jgi:hypothetical protein
MNSLLNSKDQLALSIGPYIIKVSKLLRKNMSDLFPQCVDCFEVNSEIQMGVSSIDYIIKEEEYKILPEDILVGGYEDGPLPYKVYRKSSGDYLWIRQDAQRQDILAFIITKKWSEWRLVKDNTNSKWHNSFSELAYLFPYSILNKNGIMFHGVVMEWQGRGIIVSAYSGVGKTTHTRMWKEREDALILNGDRALCYKQQDGWYTCGAPWFGTSEEYLNRSVKIDAFVILDQARVNRVRALGKLEGAIELIKHTFAPVWEDTLANNAFNHINDMVEEIPIYLLECKPDYEAVDVLKTELIQKFNNVETI